MDTKDLNHEGHEDHEESLAFVTIVTFVVDHGFVITVVALTMWSVGWR